jgi:manganese oxidase
MEPDQKVKLRVLNSVNEPLALHTHGHKPTATHYDGVDNGPASRITRDVHEIATAQRLDMELSGQNDGLHSYGEGVWMFHDHAEKSFTNDGIGEGGAISVIAYKSFLNEKGIPKLHGMSLAPYFSKTYWEKKYPIWQDFDAWNSLGRPEMKNADGTPAPTPAPAVPSKPEAKAASDGQAAQAVAAAETGTSGFGQLLKGLIFGVAAYLLFVRREQISKMLPRDKIAKLLHRDS